MDGSRTAGSEILSLKSLRCASAYLAGRLPNFRSFVARSARYIAIGAICAIINNVIIIAGDLVHFHYTIGITVAFFVTTPIGYLLHCAFTFNTTPSLQRFARFASGLATAFPLSLLLMAIFCSGLHIPVAIASPITTVLLFIWNYTSADWAIRGFGNRNKNAR
jgi:putative flippase GtrA